MNYKFSRNKYMNRDDSHPIDPNDMEDEESRHDEDLDDDFVNGKKKKEGDEDEDLDKLIEEELDEEDLMDDVDEL